MDCIFCKISNNDLPADVVFEDENIMAFRDLHPMAPTHLLVIPKQHIATVNDLTDADATLVGAMILRAKKLAANEHLSTEGYRLIFNVNSGGGQEVYHIHLHLLGGRQMTWPPG